MIKLKNIYFRIVFTDTDGGTINLCYTSSPQHAIKEYCNNGGYTIDQLQVIPMYKYDSQRIS